MATTRLSWFAASLVVWLAFTACSSDANRNKPMASTQDPGGSGGSAGASGAGSTATAHTNTLMLPTSMEYPPRGPRAVAG
jgi:hypothetical protein